MRSNATTRPSWSRWGRSAYDTDADLRAERDALGPLAEDQGYRQDAEVLVVTSGVRVDADLLDAAPSARLVVTTTSGYDHLVTDALRSRGVAAARLPLVRRDAVVDASLELLIAGLRRSGWLRAQGRAGRWARGSLPGLGMRTLRGSTIGVVGLGVIGARLAEVLGVLGAEVLGCDPARSVPGVRPVGVDEMLAEADAVSLHCHLTPATRGLLSGARLAAARPGLVVVNTARGPVLDLPAALDLLDSGHLAAVGVDVFPEEPYPHLARSASSPGLLLTPHASGYHDGLPERVREGLVATLAAWRGGHTLPHPVPLPPR